MTDSENDIPGNTMGDRVEKSKLKTAVLLQSSRAVLSAGLALGTFLLFVLVVSYLEPPFVQQLQSSDMIDTMFTTMISVVLTGTTLVVTIGQLVLTQEAGPLGDQRERMSNSMDFREYTEELTGRPTPSDPGDFLKSLVDATITRSVALRDGLDAHGEVEDEIDVFVEGVLENARPVSDQLEGAQFGTFAVVSAALDFNYSWKIARIEHFQNEYADELTADDVDLLDDLKTALSMFAPAREHVKTLYFQWELIALSQQILYAAIPAVVVAGIMTAVVRPETFPATFFGFESITIIVGAAFSVTLLPFFLFVSYIFRILTVAKRTLAIEPLILRG